MRSRFQRYQQHTPTGSDADFARVEQRTFNLESTVKDLSSDIAAVDAKFSTQLANVSNNLSTQIAGLGAKFDDRSRPQWMLLVAIAGILMTFMTVIGGLAYAPIRSTSDRVELEVARLRETTITKEEVNTRSARSQKEYDRLYNDQVKMESLIVSRPEHQEKWASNTLEMANKQRQLDELGKKVDAIYPINSVVVRLEREIEDLRKERDKARNTGG